MMILASLLISVTSATCSWMSAVQGGAATCMPKVAADILDADEIAGNVACAAGITGQDACEAIEYGDDKTKCVYDADMAPTCMAVAFNAWFKSDEYKNVGKCSAISTEGDCSDPCTWNQVCAYVSACAGQTTEAACTSTSSAAAIGVSIVGFISLFLL